MLSEKDTIDGAIRDFTMLRNHSPYRYGGKWFIAQTGACEFTAYRTKKPHRNERSVTSGFSISLPMLDTTRTLPYDLTEPR